MRQMLMGVMLLVLSSTVPVSATDDKKDTPKASIPAGAWTREANGHTLKFQFDGKGLLKIAAGEDDNGVVVTVKYTVDGNVVKGEVTEVEEKGMFPAKPPKGLKLSFKWKLKANGDAELDDLQGDGLENAKPVLEGEYVRVKAKK